MSKYIKLEDAIRAFKEWLAISEAAEDIIADLPTIEVSEDCISRGKLISELQGIWEGSTPNIPRTMIDFQNMLEEIDYKIRNAPSVVPRRAEGEWINKQEKYQMAECSNCKKVTMHEMWGDKLVYYDYCPNCGAKMKGADDE